MKNNEAVLVAVVAVAAIFILFSGFGMMGYDSYGFGGMMQWMFPGFGFMWLIMLAFWALVITALILFIKWLMQQLNTPKTEAVARRKRKRR